MDWFTLIRVCRSEDVLPVRGGRRQRCGMWAGKVGMNDSCCPGVINDL